MTNHFFSRKITNGYKRVILFLMSTFFLALGCGSIKIHSQKDCFFQNNPEEFFKYTKYDVASFGSWEYYLTEERGNVLAILRALKKKYYKDKETVNYIQLLEERYMSDYEERTMYIQCLEGNDILSDDEIYIFEYHNNGKMESGIIVLNNCNIRKRCVYVSGPSNILGKTGTSE